MKILLISMGEFSGSFGLRSISSYLKRRGHSVQMLFLIPYERSDYDALFSGRVLEEVSRLAGDSDIIGISSLTDESRRTIQVIDHLKKLNRPIVWGGIHATSCPDECIKYADIVCVGEGEWAFCELVETMERRESHFDIRNFWFKHNGQIIKNLVRPLINDLDSLPLADFDRESHYVLDNETITNAGKWYDKLSGICIHTARGCPNACSYCCSSFLRMLYHDNGKAIRKVSMETVLRQLRSLKAGLPGLKSVWFTDDTMFIRSIQELRPFIKEYKESIGLPFQCYVSPNTIDEEKLQLFIDGGLSKLEMGIQTGSENVSREFYNRHISNSAILNASRIISKYKKTMAYPNYQVIFCNPYEKEKDLLETVSLLLKLPRPFFLQTFPLQFFPASTLYDRAKQDGLLNEGGLVNYHNHKKALESNTNEAYLNFLLSLMNGPVASGRIGDIPRFFVPALTGRKVVSYFKTHPGKLAALTKDVSERRERIVQKLRRYLAIYKFALKSVFFGYLSPAG